jgi:6-phosphogluconolactonase
MTTKVVPGQLVAAPEANEVARESATRIARALKGAVIGKRNAALALSGGSTPRDAYTLLAREEGIDWKRVDVFWVDERAVPASDDRSNYRLVKETLTGKVGIPPEQVHRMPADQPDLDAGARDYERTIRDRVEADADGVPAFDVMVLGIGEDGHTASLFPGNPTVEIVDRLVAPVPARGSREARLTLTPPAIEHARCVFIIAVGMSKRDALERVWSAQGDVGKTPARIIRGCRGGVTWLIDKAAGGLTE